LDRDAIKKEVTRRFLEAIREIDVGAARRETMFSQVDIAEILDIARRTVQYNEKKHAKNRAYARAIIDLQEIEKKVIKEFDKAQNLRHNGNTQGN